ncbi:disintegrin and metalloproteinase domain-containing protein 10-like [Dermacentor silvarum]|uniref:disintegrin and metalloproteinase domain-containing protein 10-like n=1 Tax=Dermacentor silvarum TaxID=543639 RepID=UPI002100A8A6|nr:disintegrin and metalloproteinase domain-containing protein 10-like [Dermacentor silvarum]
MARFPAGVTKIFSLAALNFLQHDETPECAPGGSNGNYIMFARATTGLQLFNRKFSSCSVRSISAVLYAILNGHYDKENCFLSHQESFCGNNVREENEDCDCGYHEKDCHDLCCYARKNSQRAAGCTLRPNAQCSPSAGSCCSTECHYVSANHRCSAPNDCNHASFCRYPSLNA